MKLHLLNLIKKDLLNNTQRAIIYRSFFDDTDTIFLKNIIYIQHNIINNFKNTTQSSTTQINTFLDDVDDKINNFNETIDVLTVQRDEYLKIIKELIDKIYKN
jgi:esterase/lipase